MMHHNTSRLIYASLGCAALGLAATAAVQSPAQPNGPEISKWIQATPNRSLPACSTADPGTAEAPFFGFNGGVFQSCLIDGPYPFQGKQWFVMRIKNFAPASPPAAAGPPFDVIRVCSRDAAHQDNPNKVVPGPCHTTAGAGPLGCEVCVKGGVPQ